MLAEQTPAIFRAFDLLALDKTKLMKAPFVERREALKKLIADAPGRKKSAAGSVELTPLTKSVKTAEPWLMSGEGVIAKELDAIYKPGERKGMVKIKHVRTIDVRHRRLAARQGGGHGRLTDPRPLRQEGQADPDRPHLGAEGQGEERAGQEARALRDRRRRQRRPEPLGHATASWSGGRCAPSW